jgi:hypothetical protein
MVLITLLILPQELGRSKSPRWRGPAIVLVLALMLGVARWARSRQNAPAGETSTRHIVVISVDGMGAHFYA